MPGTAPATKSLVMDWPVSTPYMTNRMLGGMMGATIAALAFTATVNAFPYPSLIMAGIMMLPMAAQSATADPEIPPKKILVTMLVMASPPGNLPTTALANDSTRWVMPLAVIKFPAKRKKGMASSEKDSIPANMRCGMIWIGTFPISSRTTRQLNPKARDSGIRIRIAANRISMRSVFISGHLSRSDGPLSIPKPWWPPEK